MKYKFSIHQCNSRVTKNACIAAIDSVECLRVYHL